MKNDKKIIPKIWIKYESKKFATDFIARGFSHFSTTLMYKITNNFSAGGEIVLLKKEKNNDYQKGYAVSTHYHTFGNSLFSSLIYTEENLAVKSHYIRVYFYYVRM